MFHSMSVRAEEQKVKHIRKHKEMYLKNYNIATVWSQWSCFWETDIKKVIVQKGMAA